MATDPLPPVHPDDPYYLEEPETDWGFEEYEELEWWDAEVGYEWETR